MHNKGGTERAGGIVLRERVTTLQRRHIRTQVKNTHYLLNTQNLNCEVGKNSHLILRPGYFVF